jgi:N-methylhydantoinase B
VAALKTAIDLALAQIHSKQEHAVDSHCSLLFHLQYQNKMQLLDLSGGHAPQSGKDGCCAKVSALSLEELETNFPLTLLRADQRHSLGGKGKLNGGRGLIIKFALQKEVEACWLTDLTLHKPRLPKNCSHGDPCELSFEKNGQPQELPVLGQQKFKATDIVTLCSGTGGGIGRVE